MGIAKLFFRLSGAQTLLSRAEAASASKDWCTAYCLYLDLARFGRLAGNTGHIVGRRRRAGIKYQEQLRASGKQVEADQVLRLLVQEVVNFLPMKGIASSLQIPTGFDSFGAMMISHNVGEGWLPTYVTPTTETEQFIRILERGDIKITATQSIALIRSIAVFFSKAPFGFWMLAHSILFRRGLVGASYVAKEEAAKRIVTAKRMPTASRNSAAAFITGNGSEDPDSWSEDFARVIQGKSIAIVGPAENSLLSGPEIDAFDVIIRTNPIEIETLKRMAGSIGSRTDVAYYNGRALIHRQEEAHRVMHESTGLKFACFRQPEHAREAAAILGKNRVRSYEISRSIFMGRGYALRHYVADLNQFAPGRVKVFNADFFLSPKTHYDGYLDTKLNLAHSYVVHDVRESWIYMRNSFLRGTIEADAVLEEILLLSEPEFNARIATRLSMTKSKEVRSTGK